jgi:hypothetical protein
MGPNLRKVTAQHNYNTKIVLNRNKFLIKLVNIHYCLKSYLALKDWASEIKYDVKKDQKMICRRNRTCGTYPLQQNAYHHGRYTFIITQEEVLQLD